MPIQLRALQAEAREWQSYATVAYERVHAQEQEDLGLGHADQGPGWWARLTSRAGTSARFGYIIVPESPSDALWKKRELGGRGGRIVCFLTGLAMAGLLVASLVRGSSVRDTAPTEPAATIVKKPPESVLLQQASNFQTISEGRCSDFGMVPVVIGPMCREARRDLGLQGVPLHITYQDGRPEGCYLLVSDFGEAELWMSASGRNGGNGASVLPGFSRFPICTTHQTAATQPGLEVAPPPAIASVSHGGSGTVAPYATTWSAPTTVVPQPRRRDTTASTSSTTSTLTTSSTSTSCTSTSTSTSSTSTSTSSSTSTSTTTAIVWPPRPGFTLSCLRLVQEGCFVLKDRKACLASRDGRDLHSLDGAKIRGQPCVWCGGLPCTSISESLCEPFDWVVNSSFFNAPSGENSHYGVAQCAPEDMGNVTRAPTLFCFVLVQPVGYELDLVKLQMERRAGIFACDDFAIFSNETLELHQKNHTVRVVRGVHGNLEVRYGGRWNTALNSQIFVRVWAAIARLRLYEAHDWTVKADADTVFIPDRLRELLMHRPMRTFASAGGPGCQFCKLKGSKGVSCRAHVRSIHSGHNCSVALERAAKLPPQGCDCLCEPDACDTNRSAIYLNNCKFGLHGPIEVLSRDAVAVYVGGYEEHCKLLGTQELGEDDYLRLCLGALGVQKTDQFNLLSEPACGAPDPTPCTSGNVAFHPFKSKQSFLDCLTSAETRGLWP